MTPALDIARPLPIPQAMTLRNFSLYSNLKEIKVQYKDGVFCLAGANGLGKSTFLNALNFAITGLVSEPGRKFESLAEYYRYTSTYARSYFSGRIANEDREIATVGLTMNVGNHRYVLERRFFDSEALTYLRVDGPDGVLIPFDEHESDSARSAHYKHQIVRDCNLAQFEQLVFLQHFLLTFDEQHRLLLWDERTIEQALLLAFGVSADDAVASDDLRRRAERAESQARNLQYQATTAEGRIQDLVDRLRSERDEDAEGGATFEEFERQWTALSERIDRLTRELTSAQILEASDHSRLGSVEQAYEDAVALAIGVEPGAHPLVVQTVQTGACALCGSAGGGERVRAKLNRGVCSLCDHPVENTEASHEDVRALARQLADAREAARRSSVRVSEIFQSRAADLAEVKRLEADRPEIVAGGAQDPGGGATVERLIAQYESEAADARRRRDEFRERRDQYRAALKPIAKSLARRYAEAEEAFVPRFVSLARSFLGLDVEVDLQQRASRPSLIVTVQGTERRAFDQLSESQRYFLDIALRMALVEYMSGEHGGCLYIDTPEGSLDISYEARAGEMFADFATAGNRLVMTANINSSHLLLSLAKRCTERDMQIIRMMEWTPLSDVQATGEALFTDAFSELNRALRVSSVVE